MTSQRLRNSNGGVTTTKYQVRRERTAKMLVEKERQRLERVAKVMESARKA